MNTWKTPGRVCLLGEHCDWAGGASLVVPLALALSARFEPGGAGLRVRSEGRRAQWPIPPPAGACRGSDEPLRYVAAVAAELSARGWLGGAGELSIESQLPAGRGFSSSAALCVAAARALADRPLRDEDAADVAYRAERGRVGIACGQLDPLAVAIARPLLLRWRPEGYALEICAPGATLHLVAAAFQAPRDAPGILACLDRHVAGEGAPEDCDAVRAVIARWGASAEIGAAALRAGDAAALGAQMREAQRGYEALADRLPPLAAPGLGAARRALDAAGALGAKFSGAGGDGSIVALASSASHAEALAALLRGRGLSAWIAALSPSMGS